MLDVALRLAASWCASELGAEVVMTRATDVFIPLEERTAIANSKGADLFLSIHANSSRNRSARGIETYFLNFAKDPHAEEVAARENAISAAHPEGPAEPGEGHRAQQQDRREPRLRGQRAGGDGRQPAPPRPRACSDRGVRTAPFYVLIGANMPSILAEIAFVSNPDEEKRLRDAGAPRAHRAEPARGRARLPRALNRTQPTRQLTAPRLAASTVASEATVVTLTSLRRIRP